MKIANIIDFFTNTTQIAICEADDKLYYIGEAQGAYAFNDLEIEQIHIENNQLIITILTNDMLS